MWLKMLVWLGTKKGKWVLRIFAFLLAGVVQYAYTVHAEKRAYNNGYLVAKAESKTQLNDTFKKHQELLNQHYEKLTQIAEQYRALGNCHNADGIGMLNEQIRSRSKPTTKH